MIIQLYDVSQWENGDIKQIVWNSAPQIMTSLKRVVTWNDRYVREDSYSGDAG